MYLGTFERAICMHEEQEPEQKPHCRAANAGMGKSVKLQVGVIKHRQKSQAGQILLHAFC